jgi:hypothetical protein
VSIFAMILLARSEITRGVGGESQRTNKMNIFYTEKGNTQTNIRAASIREAAQLLGVRESEVEDAGEIPTIQANFDDFDDIDTTAYGEWEKSEFGVCKR